MELEVDFHDEREFERWPRRTGGGAIVGMPTVRSIDRHLHEIRVGGWRVYFTQRAGSLVVLCGGSKDTQQRDIARARRRMQ